MSSDKLSLIFWGAIQLNGRKMLVKCLNRLKAAGYLEMHLQVNIFQQVIASVHKSKIIGNLFQEKEWKVLGWPTYCPDMNTIDN